MPAKINIGDVWKDIAAIKINIGDVWKPVVKGWINIGDVWKECYSAATEHTFTYTTSGNTTLTIPSGATNLIIECWGAGGNGGEGSSSYTGYGGGGGGAYSKTTIATPTAGTYDITVGYGVNYPSSNGDTIVKLSTTVLCKAQGGVGYNTTTGGDGGSSFYGVGDVKYSGGKGANGGATYGGGGGEGAHAGGNGNNASGSTGGTGTDGGNGGNGAPGPSQGGGSNGTAPGGGGGGIYREYSSQSRGDGALGKVVIKYTA